MSKTSESGKDMTGLVQRMDIQTGDPVNPRSGPGLTISEGPGRPGVVVVYATNAEADAAAEKIRDALSGAIWVRGQGR
jgi:hypothetical protein